MLKGIDRKNKTTIYGMLTVVITFVVVMSCWKLWGTDIRVPLSGYRSDSLGMLLEASNLVRGGSLHVNENYGAPYIGEYVYGGFGDSSIPMPLIALIWKLTGSVEAGINIHAVLNILLLALSTFLVCVRLGVSDFSSMLSGIAYADMAYFLMYANTVLMIYSACFYIPLFCLIIIEIMKQNNNDVYMGYGEYIFVSAVMFFLGINSAYYTFMALIIMVFVGAYTIFISKNPENVMLVFISFVSIVMGILVYTLPSVMYSIGFGDTVVTLKWGLYIILLLISIAVLGVLCLIINKIVSHITMKHIYFLGGIAIALAGIFYLAVRKYTYYLGEYEGRSLMSVEMGALRIINLIMPSPNNIVDVVNEPLSYMVDVNQGDFVVLGIFAGIGFIYSVGYAFRYNHIYTEKGEILRVSGLVNLFMVLLAVKGGMASFIAMFVTTGIRNYNRIFVFIAFFSVLSMGYLIDSVFEKIRQLNTVVLKRTFYILTCAVLVLALSMSIPKYFIFQKTNAPEFGFVDYEQRKAEYDEWYEIMDYIEESVSDGGMILELPFSVDDELLGTLMEEQGRAYDLAIPVVISKSTVWSYGGGNKGAGWKAALSSDVEEMLMEISAFGFEGVYVDTLMYSDESYIGLLKQLEEYLGEPYVCSEGRRYFFNMAEYNKNIVEKYGEDKIKQIRDEIEAQY